MTILVTGGAGFIGSHVVDRLIRDGYRVVVVDNLVTGEKKNLNPDATFFEIDIRNPRLHEVFQKHKPQVVFHYAAHIDVRKSVENPQEDATHNIMGLLNVLENCRVHRVEKFIFASSGGAIYGNANVIPTPENVLQAPLSPYGISKAAGEQYIAFYAQDSDMSFCILRLANVYGPRQGGKGEAGVIAAFSRAFVSGNTPVVYGSGNQTRDFVFVQDVVDANVGALESSQNGVFNIGTGKETSVNEVLGIIKRLMQTNIQEVRGDPALQGQERSCLDCAYAQHVLNWSSLYTLEQGLQKTIDFFKM